MINHIAKITALLLMAVTLALAPGPVRAQDATNAPAQTTPKKHNRLPFHGKVAAVDPAAETLTVGTLTLNVTSTTKISNSTNGAPAILSDIAVGETVSGSYKKDADGQLKAQSIHIGGKAAKSKKKKAPPVDADSSTNSVLN